MSKTTSNSRWTHWIKAVPQSFWSCSSGLLALALWLCSAAFLPPLPAAARFMIAAVWAVLLAAFGYFVTKDIARLVRWLQERTGEFAARAILSAIFAVAALAWWLGPLSPIKPVGSRLYTTESERPLSGRDGIFVRSGEAKRRQDQGSADDRANGIFKDSVTRAAPATEVDRPSPATQEIVESREPPSRHEPESARDLLTHGEALSKAAKLDEAIAVLSQAIALNADPADADERALLAACLAHRGYAQRAQARLPEALRAYYQALGRASGLASLTYLDELALRDFEKAIELYRRLVEHEGRLDLGARFAMSLNGRAKTRRDRSDPGGALADFDEAAALCTRLVEQAAQPDLLHQLAISLAGRGSIRRGEKKFPEAAEDLSRAIELFERLRAESPGVDLASDHTLALTDRAHLLREQGKLTEAVRDFDQAIQLFTDLVEQQGKSNLTPQFAAALMQRDAVTRDGGSDASSLDDLDKAIGLYTGLVDQQGRSDLGSELAGGLARRGQILFRQGKAECVTDYDRAIALLDHLVHQEDRRDRSDELARCLYERGTALLEAGNVIDCMRDYDEAIALYRERIGEPGAAEREMELAGLLNDRGNLLRAQGAVSEAIGDLNDAVDLCTRLVEKQGRREFAGSLAMCLNNRAIALADQGKLRESLEDYSRAAEVYADLREQGIGHDVEANLAKSRHNRGVAWLRLHKFGEAVQDFELAVRLYGDLLAQAPRPDLAQGLAGSLNTLAKIYGLSNEAKLRNTAKAIEYATRACELTQHQDADMLNTLASAYAGARDYVSAYYWQAKAVQLGPTDTEGDNLARLEYYRLMKSRLR